MGVDFGGCYRLVAEHGLYGSQVGSSVEQCCSKAVPECVGANVLFNACHCHKFLYQVEHHYAREVLLAQLAYKYIVLVARLDVDMAALRKVDV